MKLGRPFFARDALVVARALVGTTLVFRGRRARIVETEAYRGPTDLACHARVGLTERNRPLFGAPGTAYVYFVYGMHELFNVVCKAEGSGHAVLVRAAEPVSGFQDDARTDGPARLAKAMGLTRALNECSLHAKDAAIWLLPRDRDVRVATSPRVGVGYAGAWADEPWRFFDEASAWVSRPPKHAIGRPTAKRARRA